MPDNTFIVFQINHFFVLKYEFHNYKKPWSLKGTGQIPDMFWSTTVNTFGTYIGEQADIGVSKYNKMSYKTGNDPIFIISTIYGLFCYYTGISTF